MIRAALDANVIVSGVFGLAREASPPGAIWRAWERRLFELVVAAPLIAEVERTLTNTFFASKIGPHRTRLTVSALREDARLTRISVEVEGIATHPEDDLVLAAAVSAEADYLVTGDRQLQALGRYLDVEIVSPRAFLAVLEQDPPVDH